MFKGVEKAKVSRSANYARPGRYIAFVRKVETGKNRKKEGFAVVNLVCLMDLSEGTVDNPHRPGEEFSDMMMEKFDSFLGNFKGMVTALTGYPEDQITQEVCEYVTSEDQPLAGLVVEMENIERQTKESTPENPRFYTMKNYRRVLTMDEIEKTLDPESLPRLLTGAELEYLGGKEQGSES
jgi:hypothetical protein